MEENDIQRQVRQFEADLNKRLDDKSFILDDDINHDLWLEDVDSDNEDETGIDPRDKYVPELDETDDYTTDDVEYSQDTMDPYLGAEVNMPEGDGYRRAVVKRRKEWKQT